MRVNKELCMRKTLSVMHVEIAFGAVHDGSCATPWAPNDTHNMMVQVVMIRVRTSMMCMIFILKLRVPHFSQLTQEVRLGDLRILVVAGGRVWFLVVASLKFWLLREHWLLFAASDETRSGGQPFTQPWRLNMTIPRFITSLSRFCLSICSRPRSGIVAPSLCMNASKVPPK